MLSPMMKMQLDFRKNAVDLKTREQKAATSGETEARGACQHRGSMS